jgi:four helix bundle protein
MTYQRFEDLPVWKDAIELAVKIYELTEHENFKGKHSLKDQIERAAVSISNNIAEGFERGTTQELITFLYIARGSAGEVRSMLCLFERIALFSNLQSPISTLKPKAESISRQLRAWADTLQNSDVKGQRYLNEKLRDNQKRTQEREERKRELDEFDAELKQMVEAARRRRERI